MEPKPKEQLIRCFSELQRIPTRNDRAAFIESWKDEVRNNHHLSDEEIDMVGGNLVIQAAANGKTALLEVLLNRGQFLGDYGGNKALRTALTGGHVNCVILLLARPEVRQMLVSHPCLGRELADVHDQLGLTTDRERMKEVVRLSFEGLFTDDIIEDIQNGGKRKV